MKKTMSLILAVTLIISVASGIFLSDIVSAGGVPLPTISGNTKVDTDASDKIDGDFVIIQNTGSSNQSTGVLNNIESAFSAYSRINDSNYDENVTEDGIFVDDNGKMDFAMPLLPEYASDAPKMSRGRGAVTVFSENTAKDFKIMGVLGNEYQLINFTLQTQGTHCNVWIPTTPENANGSPIAIDSTATQTIADEFDNAYEKMIAAFGAPLVPEGSDSRINLMMYDIQDGNNPAAYIAGFYSSGDFRENRLPMLHIDTYPAIYSPNGRPPRVSNCYSTLIHEFQHLINDSRRVQSGGTSMPTWLNESLSMAAEEMIFEDSAVPMRLNTYLRDPYEDIKNGKSITNFDSRLDSYALSCLFSAYLKEQTGDTDVFKRIIDEYYGSGSFDCEQAIVNAVENSQLDGLDFDDVLAAYKLALTINDERGIYGFKNNPAFSTLKPHIYSESTQTLPPDGMIVVKPSEGKFIPVNSDSDVRFIGTSEYTGSPLISDIPLDLVVGETHQLQGTPGTGDNTLNWSSSDDTVASVDDNGLVTATGIGSATISLTNNSATDSAVITVKEPYVNIINPPATIRKGRTAKLEYEFRPAVPPNTIGIAWSSSNSNIIVVNSVNNNHSITATGNVEESATITLEVTCNGQTYTDSFEVTIEDDVQYPGLEVDFDNKHINVIESVGMDTLGKIVNGTAYIGDGFDPGLADWTIDLTCPITLENHVPIGGQRPFSGTFNGNSNNITLVSINNSQSNDYAGIFSRNYGTLNDVNVTVTGTIGTSYISVVGTVCADNSGSIITPTVIITETGEVNGEFHVGGVVGESSGSIDNAKVIINGTIHAIPIGHSDAGGVAGYASNVDSIKDAEVFINGSIRSGGHAGGLVAHTCGRADGNININIGPNGSVYGDQYIGGVIGYKDTRFFSGSSFGSDSFVSVRIDGNIITENGQSGGVVGQGGFAVNSDHDMPTVAVTLGPESKVDNLGSGHNGLITSEPFSFSNKIVYAVPYDSPYRAYPGDDSAVKRIEYPNSLNPNPQINVENETNVLFNGEGIFKKVNALASKPLSADSVFDDNLFVLDKDNQKVKSTYQILRPNYYDFNLVADGIPITVPAYLYSGSGEALPPMQIHITDNTPDQKQLYTSEADARSYPVLGRQSVRISALNGSISSWGVTLNGVDYTSSILLEGVGDTSNRLKEFSLFSPGLYKITAIGTPLDPSQGDEEMHESYVYIGGGINLLGDDTFGHNLTSQYNENLWTNLDADSQTQLRSSNSRNSNNHTNITAKAINTTIDSISIKKDAVKFPLYDSDYISIPAQGDTERTFSLYDTGKYQITATGVGLDVPATGYINIDVDNPLLPKIETSSTEMASIHYWYDAEYLNINDATQSPIHAEYRHESADYTPEQGSENDAFTRLNGYDGVLPLDVGKTRIRSVDDAGNISDEIIVEKKEITINVKADPTEGGTVGIDDGPDTVKTYTTVKIGDEAEATVQAKIKAEAKGIYKFVEWRNSDDNSVVSNSEAYTVNTTQSMNLIAIFVEQGKKTIEVTTNARPPEGGIVSGDKKITVLVDDTDTKLETTIKAVPNTGYSFVRWETDDNSIDPAKPEQTVQRKTNMNYTAIFEKIKSDITVTAKSDPSAGGTVKIDDGNVGTDISKTYTLEFGQTVEVKITALSNKGYELKSINTVDFDGIKTFSANKNGEVFILKDKDIDVVAHFEKIVEPPVPPTPSEPEPPAPPAPEPPISSKPTSADSPRGDYIKLDYTADMGGKITGEAEQWIKRYSDGTTVTAIPSDGYRFVKWSDGNTNPDRHDTAVFNDLSVTAWFEQIPVYNAPSVIKPVEVPKTGAKNPIPYILAIASLTLGVLGYSIYRFRKTEFKK